MLFQLFCQYSPHGAAAGGAAAAARRAEAESPH